MKIIEQEPHIEIAQKRLRLIAFIIDLIFYTIIITAIGKKVGLYNKILLSFPTILILWPISEAFFGQTFGKRVLNIKVINHDLSPIGFKQAFIRFIAGIIDMPMFLGLIIATLDKDNRRIGDKIAKTLVVRKIYFQKDVRNR